MQNPSPSQRRRTRLISILFGRLSIALVLGIAVFISLVWGGATPVPNHLNPFAPLRVSDEVNWLTRLKLSRLERSGPQCLSVLAASDVSYRTVTGRREAEGCGFSNAVEVSEASRDLSRSFTASCPLAVAWGLFDRHVVGRAARRYLGQDVARIIHFGTYACRNINHRMRGRRSEHATANAIDIAGFVLTDGQLITLKNDWNGDAPSRTAFLQAVRDGACGLFNVVLSPDYNEIHHDHFHFDMGFYRACR